MRQRTEYDKAGPGCRENEDSREVCLFEDYAFMNKTVSDKFIIGHIERIQLQGEHGLKDYRRPVDINADNKDKLHCTVMEFQVTSVSDQGMFLNMESKCLRKRKFKDIICKVDLHVQKNQELLLLKEHFDSITKTVTKLCEPRQKSRSQVRSITEHFNSADFENIDGTVVTVVEPNSNGSGSRRSTRTRKTRLALDS